MSVKQPIIWTGRPPTGTGVQSSRVQPTKQLPWNAWFRGRIARFCPTAEAAFAAVAYERSEA